MRKKLIIFILITVISVSLAVSFSGCKNTSEDESSVKSGSVSDYPNDFTLKNMSGEEVSLSDFKGKVIVLNFWATWCPPCKAEIPDFVEVYETYKDKDVIFLGVSVDEDVDALKDFIKSYEINYPILLDTRTQNVSGIWGVSGIPTTFFIDENGKIIGKRVGQMPAQDLIKAIEATINS